LGVRQFGRQIEYLGSTRVSSPSLEYSHKGAFELLVSDSGDESFSFGGGPEQAQYLPLDLVGVGLDISVFECGGGQLNSLLYFL